jgi:hypothetical protein
LNKDAPEPERRPAQVWLGEQNVLTEKIKFGALAASAETKNKCLFGLVFHFAGSPRTQICFRRALPGLSSSAHAPRAGNTVRQGSVEFHQQRCRLGFNSRQEFSKSLAQRITAGGLLEQ